MVQQLMTFVDFFFCQNVIAAVIFVLVKLPSGHLNEPICCISEVQQNFTANRGLSLLGSERHLLATDLFTAVPQLQFDPTYLVFPHITVNCTTIYSTGNYDCNQRRGLVRTDARPWWPNGSQERDTILLYITE